ncbi:MAG TPA: rhomboid family intramembrane serine protease, partial [Pseudonocardia sp.]|nr:rhomboid family intramembrane serine protease [Pseudonocardia sp.]
MTGSPGNSGGPVAGEPSGATPPTCYRHPSRETYIRCTRCGRSICPDCMIQAPVGFHCPMCVAEGAKSVRHARTTLG